jgi:hypothetical protein
MDFEFPAKVDDLETIPEQFRGVYIQQDGEKSGVLIEQLAKKTTDMGNLQTSMQTDRKRLNQAEKALKRWEALGGTPDELADKLSTWSELGESPDALRQTLADKDRLISEKGDVGKQIEQMKQAHAADLAKRTEVHKKELESAQSTSLRYRRAMEQEKIDSSLTTEIAKQKGVPKLLLPIARSVVKVLEEDGEFVTRVIDRDGDTRVNSKGDPMSIGDLIQEMKNDPEISYGFEGEGRSGSGSSGTTQQRRGGTSGQSFTLAAWTDKLARATAPDRMKLMQMKGAGQIQVTQ